MRTFVIGDIHGGYEALCQVLQRANFNYENDTLIVLGDVADGWPDTAQVVEELLKIKHRISIMGNHDKWAYDWLRYQIAPNLWRNQGGEATFQSYAIYNPELMLKHEKEYFAKCHLYYIDDENRGYVHGGYASEKGLGHEPHEANYYWDRELWQVALSGKMSQQMPKLLRAHKEIFIGHTTTMMWKTDKPMNACNVWNLDTGGGYKGKLTIMNVDTKEYWQSDPLQELYPNVEGR